MQRRARRWATTIRDIQTSEPAGTIDGLARDTMAVERGKDWNGVALGDRDGRDLRLEF